MLSAMRQGYSVERRALCGFAHVLRGTVRPRLVNERGGTHRMAPSRTADASVPSRRRVVGAIGLGRLARGVGAAAVESMLRDRREGGAVAMVLASLGARVRRSSAGPRRLRVVGGTRA
jgi:hypothetical protein